VTCELIFSTVLVSSSRVTDRINGLKDLIHILRHNRGKPSLEALGNKAYMALCDTLFQCTRDERSAFLRGKTTKTSKPILPLCASAIRLVVNTGVRTIKSSTVESIIDGVLEVLPGNDEALIKPLAEDLPKALRALLEYQPHVERLSRECWDATVDFCIESLSGFLVEPEADAHNSWNASPASRSRTPFESTDLTTKSSSRNQPGKKPIDNAFVHAAEDFVHCLHFLTMATNAPVLEKASGILTALEQYVHRKSGRGTSAALSTINAVLSRTSLHSVELTKHTIQTLLPLMRSMWSDAALKDEILVTLMHTEPHLASILADHHAETASSDLEALIEMMYLDYRRRQESTANHFLEDDHLCFRHIGKARSDTHPLNTYAFSMETEYLKSESLWATVSAIARYSAMLDVRKRAMSQEREDEEESFIKRLRITHHYQEYLRHVSEPRSNAKRAALQVIAFMVQEIALDEEDLQSTLERLTACISDENSVHSSWAMLGLAA
jgi:ataxia telangiectasia mutated family protein